MRGHSIPSRCPRCSEPSLPSPDQRLIDCPKCRLSYDWLARAGAEDTSTETRRGSPPTLDPPKGLTTKVDGKNLQLTLPRLTGHGVSMIAVALASAGTGVAMTLAENRTFAFFLFVLALGFGVVGVVVTFTRRRLRVTDSELRMDRVPFGGTSAVIALGELHQLAIARTRRGRHQAVDDIELWAQASERDVFLLSTRDVDLARYLEQRVEFHLQIADDGVEMVIPGVRSGSD